MKLKKPSTENATPAASKDFVVFARAGFVYLTPTRKARCRFVWQTIDGMLNGFVELKAKPEVVQHFAFSARPTVEVELFDLEFRVRSAAYNKVTRTLYLLACSFFAGIARALDSRQHAGRGALARLRRRTARHHRTTIE
jgi:hypothetical protein